MQDVIFLNNIYNIKNMIWSIVNLIYMYFLYLKII